MSAPLTVPQFPPQNAADHSADVLPSRASAAFLFDPIKFNAALQMKMDGATGAKATPSISHTPGAWRAFNFIQAARAGE